MSAPTSTRHVWSFRFAYLGLSALIVLISMLPLGLAGAGFPGPDVLLALTLAWLLRQPTVVPFVSIVLVFLLADFLMQRPPGLWTLLAVIATESLRRRRLVMTELPFLVEWGAVAVTVMAMVIGERLILWLLFLDLPPLGLSLAHGLVTIALYPVVVAVSKYVFGLRKLGPAELETL